jgi:hypothetical protein
MLWKRLVLTSVVGCTFLGGCSSSGTLPDVKSPPSPGVARSQDDGPVRIPPQSGIRATSFLDTLPDQPADAVSGLVAARIYATVNGYPIFEEEIETNLISFKPLYEPLPEPERTQKKRQLMKEILDSLIERELLIQDALLRLKKNGPSVMAKLQDAAEKEFDKKWMANMKKGNGIKSDDQLKEMLRRQGASLDMIRRQWTRQFISTEYLRNRVVEPTNRIGHEHMIEYYEQHPEEYKIDDAVEWLDLFVSINNPRYKTPQQAQATAEQLAARLRKGEDFLTLAKEYDDGPNAGKGGEGIGKKQGDIQPAECEGPLFSMQPGDVGVIEIGSGYHVFRLVKREYAGKKPFDVEVQKDIRNKLRGAMYEREVKKFVADLKRKAIIEKVRGR